MKIRVIYWPFLGSQSAILGNVRGFQHFSDVEFVPLKMGVLPEAFTGADLIFFPDFGSLINNHFEVFVVLQMGGRGPSQFWRMGGFKHLHRVSSNAQLVTILDPNLYRWLNKKEQPWKWNLFHIVPNGLHYDMFKPTPRVKEDFVVLAPKIGGPGKSGLQYATLAKSVHDAGYKQIKFIAPVQYFESYTVSQDFIPVDPLPFYKMPQLYQNVDLVVNVPPVEVLPNSVFETFLSGKPLIVGSEIMTCIGDIQTVHTSYLEKMRKDFGLSVDYFDENWKDKYWTGDHFLAGSSLEEVTKQVIECYEHPDLREKIGRKGREWALKLNWTWKDKCGLILDLAKKEGWVDVKSYLSSQEEDVKQRLKELSVDI